MQCVDPGRVSPEDLLAYATGDAGIETIAHVAVCASCAAESRSYATADRALARTLFRVDCPDSQKLGELALSLLDPEDVFAVRSHLALCHHCRQELAEVSAALQDDPLESLRQPGRVRRVLARLLPPSTPAPAYAPVRGGSASGAASDVSSYEAEDVTVSLRTRGEDDESWSLLGMVTVGDATALSGLEVRALRDGATERTGTLDEWGHVAMARLPAGTYEVELELPDRIIAAEGIRIGADAD